MSLTNSCKSGFQFSRAFCAREFNTQIILLITVSTISNDVACLSLLSVFRIPFPTFVTIRGIRGQKLFPVFVPFVFFVVKIPFPTFVDIRGIRGQKLFPVFVPFVFFVVKIPFPTSRFRNFLFVVRGFSQGLIRHDPYGVEIF